MLKEAPVEGARRVCKQGTQESLRITGGRHEGDTDNKSGLVNASFLFDFEKSHDCRRGARFRKNDR